MYPSDDKLAIYAAAQPCHCLAGKECLDSRQLDREDGTKEQEDDQYYDPDGYFNGFSDGSLLS